MNNSNESSSNEGNEKSGRKMAEEIPGAKRGAAPSGLSKWKRRVQASTRAYFAGGPATEYVVRLQAGGTRRYVQLGTGDLKEAAERAQQLFFDIKSIGWLPATAKLRPSPPIKPVGDLTVGEYLAHVREKHLLDDITFSEYALKLRTLLSHFLKIPGKGPEKWGKFEGQSAWQARVDATKLSDISPATLSKFMIDFVERRSREAAEQRVGEKHEKTTPKNHAAALRAKHTINCLVRNARSLFSRRKIIPHLTISLPKEFPFDGVKLLRESDSEFRFIREIDPEELLEKAVTELVRNSRTQFVIFLLSLGAGLRRNEIDKLCWRDIDFQLGTVEVARSIFQKGKSTSSLRKIKFPVHFCAALAAFRGDAQGNDFVIPSGTLPRVNETYRHYRCAADFIGLCRWLREKGISREQKALHSLRKYYGDIICSKQGIYAASKALGHQKVSTTERHYAAPPEVAAAPFGFSNGNPFDSAG